MSDQTWRKYSIEQLDYYDRTMRSMEGAMARQQDEALLGGELLAILGFAVGDALKVHAAGFDTRILFVDRVYTADGVRSQGGTRERAEPLTMER